MITRYVEKPIAAVPEQIAELEKPPPFDCTTKAEGSLNTTVAQKKITEEFLAKRK